MRNLPYPFPILARLFVPLALLLLGLTGCSGGGGGTPPPVINLPPVATNACPAIYDSLNYVDLALPATDPNGDTLTYTIASQPAHGTVTPASNTTGLFRYTPNIPVPDTGRRGMDSFTFTVRDTGGLTSAPATVSILNSGIVRIMPLGDSITAGLLMDGTGTEIPVDQWVGYRRKLYNDLVALYQTKFGINLVGTVTNLGASTSLADRDNEGHDGWTDDEILNGTSNPTKQLTCFVSNCNITGWLDSAQPDIVLLHIGTNGINSPGGTSPTDVEGILNAIDAWETANSSPVTVFLARIIGSPDPTTNTNVTTFNSNVEVMALARIASGDKIVIVNQQTGANLDYSIDVGDGVDFLHPTQAGYDKMADKWKADLISSGVLPSCP